MNQGNYLLLSKSELIDIIIVLEKEACDLHDKLEKYSFYYSELVKCIEEFEKNTQ